MRRNYLHNPRLPEVLSTSDETRLSIGKLVRRFRRQKGLTLKELSSRCCISVSHLSKLESDRAGVSVANLRRLASTLGVSVSSLIGTDLSQQVQPVRRGKGLLFRRQGGGLIVTEEFLHLGEGAQMQPEIITFPPATDSGEPLVHLGEEFLYVVAGRLVVFLDGQEPIRMETGDSLYFDASRPHRYENTDPTRVAQVLVVSSPPSF